MHKIFSKIKKEIEKYDSQREDLIKQSRDLLRVSKKLIYALHRDSGVIKALNEVYSEKSKLEKITQKIPELVYEGAYSEAMQEYAEAITYHHYVHKKELLDPEQVGVSDNDYLLGICDLTGELNRRAVACVIKKNYQEIEQIRNFVEEVYQEFLEFSFRNGLLRKKSDDIKYNLRRIEGVMYDLELKKQ